MDVDQTSYLVRISHQKSIKKCIFALDLLKPLWSKYWQHANDVVYGFPMCDFKKKLWQQNWKKVIK